MSGGSQQQRRFRIAYREHGDIERAADEAGIGIREARLIVSDDAKNPPPPEAFVLLGHNRQEPTMSDNIAVDQLRLLIERIERLEEEKKGISDDIRDVYAEAKGTGFDAKTMRAIVRERKMEKHQRDEAAALLDTYRAALGMLSGTPLGDYALSRAA